MLVDVVIETWERLEVVSTGVTWGSLPKGMGHEDILSPLSSYGHLSAQITFASC